MSSLEDFGIAEAYACILLAQYTPLDEDIEKPLDRNAVKDEMIEDLLSMVKLIPKEFFENRSKVILAPRFKGLDRVLGAEPDLIIDNQIIDIKSSEKFSLDRSYIRQLVAYLALERLDGIASAPEKINLLGIYYARYGVLETWEVEEFISSENLDKLVQWFAASLPKGQW